MLDVVCHWCVALCRQILTNVLCRILVAEELVSTDREASGVSVLPGSRWAWMAASVSVSSEWRGRCTGAGQWRPMSPCTQNVQLELQLSPCCTQNIQLEL